jgi:hypothetical protein
MFRSLFQNHLQGLFLALSAYRASGAGFVICLPTGMWLYALCLYLYPLYLPECCLVMNSLKYLLCMGWFLVDEC